MSSHDNVEVRFRLLRDGAVLPRYHSEQAAGLDLCACLEREVTLEPGRIAVIPCGFAMAMPAGYEGQVRPRSGLASKHAITLPNAPGTIDADYRGEVSVPLINLGKAAYTVRGGDRIAQMVIAPVVRASIVEVEELEATARGVGGFGSTGRA